MDPLKSFNISVNQSGASTGSEWWSNNRSKHIESFNPSTGKVIGKVFQANANDYEKVIKDSQLAFQTWRNVPAPKRGDIVRQIGNALREQKDALGSLVALEMGKIKAEGDGEVQEMIDMADFAAGQSRMLYGKTMHSERVKHRMYEQWHPLGPIGVISAFNFPVAVWAWNAFIGAICGNTIVWRPSPKTPLCAVAVQHICNQVMSKNGFQGVFSMFISDEVELSRGFCADKRLPLISFTGSTDVGRQVGQVLAKRMGRCILELSGNNAVIVDETADMKLTVPAIVFGAIGTCGQRCTSTRRIIAHESIIEQLTLRLKKAYSQIKIGDPLKKDTLMGPLIDAQAMRDYKKALVDVHDEGGKIIYGGSLIQQDGHFVEPTLVRFDQQQAVVKRETFAPILYIMPYESLDEAIAIQNDVTQGLSSSLFTQNLKRAERYLSSLGSDCGIANINIGTSGAEIGGAFGGEKDTGGGREAGSDAWKTYMRRQTNTINWSERLPLAQGIKFDFDSAEPPKKTQ